MSLLSYGVYLINTLYSIQSNVSYLVETVYEGYREKRWIFPQRNAYPVMTSSSWNNRDADGNGCLALYSVQGEMLTYYPATYTFAPSDSDKISLDIVTAELTTPFGVYDLSSFFYSVKWHLAAPSLYELVLLFLLHEKLCLTTSTLDSSALTILTSDAEEHVIEMNSVVARQPFRGFTEGLSKATTEGLKVD
jgi:hypothetical protein